jgi:hypothetical protein
MEHLKSSKNHSHSLFPYMVSYGRNTILNRSLFVLYSCLGGRKGTTGIVDGECCGEEFVTDFERAIWRGAGRTSMHIKY